MCQPFQRRITVVQVIWTLISVTGATNDYVGAKRCESETQGRADVKLSRCSSATVLFRVG